METKKEAETFSAKTLRRLLAPAVVLLVLCLVFIAPVSAASTFSGGNGNSDNPYQISSADDLKKLADLVNAGDVNYKSKFYKLTTSITLNGDWMPIGNSSTNYFSGTFDGAGHTISGLSITSSKTNGYYGLFGYLGGTVQNLNVAGSITLDEEASTSYIGGLVGYNAGTIQNCSSAVSISASSSAVIYAGGLVGYYSGGSNSVVSKSSATGDVTTTTTYAGANNAKDNEFTSSTGGLVGYFKGGEIENCYASGTVRTENNAATATNYAVISAGGIVGCNEAAITNCFSTSQVTADFGNGKAYAGGITGYQKSGTSNCFTTGSVTANTTSRNSYAGGIAGISYASIEKCYATGKVTANPTEGNTHAGGLVGRGEFNIANSYALNSGISGGYNNGTAGSTAGATLTSNYVLNGLFNPSDGTPVASSEVWNKLFAPFNDENVWMLNDAANFKLPILKNLPAPVNADASHLSVPCITFNANGGIGTMQPLFVDKGKSVELTSNAFKKEGYSFAGWATSASGEVDYKDNETISNVNADITLYAKWEVNQYILRFEDFYDSTTVYCETKLDYGATVPTTFEGLPPSKTGYTFYGWHIAIPSTMPADNVTIMALWNITQYNVTFNTMGGSAIPILKVNYSEIIGQRAPADPTKHGYKFEGWYNESDCINKWIMIGDGAGVVTDNITLYANWTGWTHTVRFHRYVDGAVQGNEQVQILTYGSNTELMANPFDEPNDKYFGGWATTKGGTIVYLNGADVTGIITSDSTAETDLYTVWEDSEITRYNVIFMDGTKEYARVAVRENTALGASNLPARPTKDGYAFEGWYKDEEFNTAFDPETHKITGETKLYAKWSEGNPVNPSPGGNNGGTGGGGSVGGGSSAPSVKPSTPTTPTTPEVPDTPKTVTEKQEIPTGAENAVTMPTGETVFVIALDNTEVIQSVAVPEAVANANPGASVQVTEGGEAPALPEGVNTDDVHIVVGVSVVDKEGNPVSVKEAGYFILEADVPKGKKLVVGHYKNDIWVDCVVEALGSGQYKVNYNGLSPFAALFIDEHEESPFAAEEQPAESPVPVLGMLLGGLAAAVILRRK